MLPLLPVADSVLAATPHYSVSNSHHTRPTASAPVASSRQVFNQPVRVYLSDAQTWSSGTIVEEVTRTSDGTVRFSVAFKHGAGSRTGNFDVNFIRAA
ncbi:hypothetical protein PsYK624_048230 [Phanerochaete sordida]|uniref:Uncharacterized protein n=1 Tax=Phanerochaete sordida TaxID=48140 RepID=A0A9P3G746_9APHY|nr:hypothetical protein PsYK624_048230 [Phanerochaete sordida]